MEPNEMDSLPASVLEAQTGDPDPAPVPLPGDRFVAVIDDDPTGIQTVHGVGVLMDDSRDMILDAARRHPLFFIETNSRAMDEDQAAQTYSRIMERLVSISRETGMDFTVVSRSDSTLRGHYPRETQALRRAYERMTGSAFDGEILVPFFLEGGRYTIGDVHYVRRDAFLIPAGQTEFARDPAFGYAHSDLRRYICEKHRGRVRPGDVGSITLEDLRGGDGGAAYRKLMGLSGGGSMIVNAVHYGDLAALTRALRRAEAEGRRFLYRTAASFVRAYGGIAPRPLLTSRELIRGRGGPGVVVVGSHVRRTTEQLRRLLELPRARAIEADAGMLLAGGADAAREISRCAGAIDAALGEPALPVVYTSRAVITAPGGDSGANLAIARAVSHGVVSILRAMKREPAFVIAKGGITASDVAAKALGIRTALALGQILPGVPVIRCGPESRFPGMPCVIFPGNVGGEYDLREAAQRMEGS